MSDAVSLRRAAAEAQSFSSSQVSSDQRSAPPTRGRKLRALTGSEVEAARAVIQSPPPPQRGGRITFPKDNTPAEPEGPPPKPSSRPRGRPKSETVASAAILPAKAAAATVDDADIAAARQQIAAAKRSIDSPGATKFSAPKLSETELAQVIALVQQKYGPILSLDEASEISKLAKQTLRERVCDGYYADAVVRGRPLRFWAHRFVPEVMS